MNIRLNTYFALALILSACGGDQHGSSAGQDGGAYRDSYELSSDGCSTGKHEFSAGTRVALDRAYCEALRDETRNHGCASEFRAALLAERCGFPMPRKAPRSPAPTTPPVAPPAPRPAEPRLPETPPPPAPEVPAEIAWPEREADEKSFRSLTLFLKIKGYELEEKLEPRDQQLALGMIRDAVDCGFRALGKSCLDGVGSYAYDGMGFVTFQNELYFYTEFLPNDGSRIAVLYRVKERAPVPRAEETLLYKMRKARGGESPTAFLSNPANITRLATLRTGTAGEAGFWEPFARAENIRQLYHTGRVAMAAARMEESGIETPKRAFEASIRARWAMILESDNPVYREAVLSLVIEELGLSQPIVADLAEALLTAGSRADGRLAAAVLLSLRPERVSLRSLTVEALLSRDTRTQLIAIGALRALGFTDAERKRLGEVAETAVSEVREAIRKALGTKPRSERRRNS